MTADKVDTNGPSLGNEKGVVRYDEDNGGELNPVDDGSAHKSPGVRAIEVIISMFSRADHWLMWSGLFLVSYARGFDGMYRPTYQAAAVSGWNNAALVATLGVVRAVCSASSQPVFAKISDYMGRLFALFLSTLLFTGGYVVMTSANGMNNYAGGFILSQLGFAGQHVFLQILIADQTSLRSRLIFTYVPSLHLIINAWASGAITQAVLNTTTWRWGFGITTIIFPVMTIPLFISLIRGEHKAKRAGKLKDTTLGALRSESYWKEFFWSADLVGLFLLAATLGLILLPFTLGGSSREKWKTAGVLTPLVVGMIVALPAFVVWELKWARYPVVPFTLLKNRVILCGLAVGMLNAMALMAQGSYLYFTTLVAFGKSVKVATWVNNVSPFVQTIVGIGLGFLVRWTPYLKYYIISGGLLFVVSYGLLIRYRGGYSSSDFAGLVAGEVVIGFARAFTLYPAQVILQASISHEHMAIITAVFHSCFQIGNAVGSTISGSIWTNTMPQHLRDNLIAAGIANATTEAKAVYGNPIAWIAKNPPGTPARAAVDLAYRQVQRYICYSGFGMSVLLVIVACGLTNPRLGENRSAEDAPATVDESKAG